MPVSQFVSSARLLLERHLGLLWIGGEISGITRAASGHLYFTLKDASAQVRCVFFRHKAQGLGFALREGLAVEVRAVASIYEPRGEFQLNVETIRQAGQGALYERFVARKRALEAAGLFDSARKRALPAYPRRVGIVTSRRAAALRDVLTTLARRAPGVPVILYPAAVQGAGAASEIAAAARSTTCGRSTRRSSRARCSTRGCRSSRVLATKPISRSATSLPTFAPQRRPRRQGSSRRIVPRFARP